MHSILCVPQLCVSKPHLIAATWLVLVPFKTVADVTVPSGFSFNLLALLFCAHYLLPRSQAYTSKFFTLQKYNDQTNKYGAGFDDIYFVFLVVVILTGLRAATMEYVLAPFAKYMGLPKKKEVTRFSEQAWLVVYCVIFWSMGFVRTFLFRSPRQSTGTRAIKVAPLTHATLVVSLLFVSSLVEYEGALDELAKS